MSVPNRLARWRSALNARLSGVLDLRDVFWISGLAAVGYGAYQIYEPAAWIVCGVALYWMGIRA